MHRSRRLLLIILICLSGAISAAAQVMPSYLFLEVKDSAGKPIEDAKVEMPRFNGAGYTWSAERSTDTLGRAQFYPMAASFPKSSFAVAKDGYYTYHDLGVTVNRDRVNAVLELLKIPQSKAERRALGDEQLKREFMWAAKRGDAANLRELLKQGISPNLNSSDLRGIPGPPGVPAIVFVVETADSEALKVLLDAGARITGTNEKLRNILSLYLWYDPFTKYKPANDAERQTILRKYEDGVAALLKAGAKPDLPDYGYERPIAAAASKGYARIVEMLLDHGASPNARSYDGQTVLMKAAARGYGSKESSVEMVRILLERGADPNAVVTNSACGSALARAAARGDVESMRLLIEKGAKINTSCKEASALMHAVWEGQTKAVEFLLDAGADVTVFGERGERIVAEATRKGDAELVRLLIRRGFPVNSMSGSNSALLIAVVDKYPPNTGLVDALLESGADPNYGIFDSSGECATPLTMAVQRGDADIARRLIAKKANVNFVCRNEESVLTKAMAGFHPIEMVKLLIDAGLDVRGPVGSHAMELFRMYPDRYPDNVRQLLAAAGAK